MVGDVSSIGSFTGPSIAARRALSGAQTAGAQTTSAQTTATQTTEAQQQVQKLKQADANVRQHEAAHQAAGGGHAGSASFTYTRGPDGKSYATAGEVQVDISAESDPSATVSKMEQVKAAALAPNDPSPQDLRVAAQADAQKLKAQSELRGNGGDTAAGGATPAGGAASPALAARGAAAYGAAQALGMARAGGTAPGAGLVV